MTVHGTASSLRIGATHAAPVKYTLYWTERLASTPISRTQNFNFASTLLPTARALWDREAQSRRKALRSSSLEADDQLSKQDAWNCEGNAMGIPYKAGPGYGSADTSRSKNACDASPRSIARVQWWVISCTMLQTARPIMAPAVTISAFEVQQRVACQTKSVPAVRIAT